MNKITDMINIYPLSKTLRFELQPVGKTLEKFKSFGLCAEDESLAKDYKQVKKLIDSYHKDFIEISLKKFQSNSSFVELFKSEQESLISALKEKNVKESEKSTEVLCKLIANCFDKNRIFSEGFIKEDLPGYLEAKGDAEGARLVGKFKDFTTYFVGFYENRKNMYSPEPKATSIANRLINENMPKFLGNVAVFQRIKSVLGDKLEKLFSELKSDVQKVVPEATSIDCFFISENYVQFLTQSQIEIYNIIIGGVSRGDIKIQGVNEYINLFNQQHRERDSRLPKMIPLFKQILSDREKSFYLPQTFENDNDLLRSVNDFYKSLEVGFFDDLKKCLENIGDGNGVFIKNDLSLTNISQRWFGSWEIVKLAIEKNLAGTIKAKKKETEAAFAERVESMREKIKSFSVAELNKIILAFDSAFNSKTLRNYFVNLDADDTTRTSDMRSSGNLIDRIKNEFEKAKPLLGETYSKKLSTNKDDVALVKNLLDAIKDLQRFIKPLRGSGEEPERNSVFYGDFDALWNKLDVVTPLYNKVRNYLTKKPYSVEKFKLNFENSQLAGGWDVNKEGACNCIIFKKDADFFLGVLNKRNGGENSRIFNNLSSQGECYQKMDYKLLPGPNKMLPKVFFSKKNIDFYAPSEEIVKLYDAGTFKKGENFNLKDCHKLIDFFKASIAKNKDWKIFDFKFSDTKAYADISQFYKEVQDQGYKISFRNIAKSEIDSLVENGKMFLFKIYNKDFSKFSMGTPNMHTLYWRAIFDPENLKDTVFALSGGAELFYRPASLKYDKPTHPKNVPIKKKNPLNPGESKFEYDLIKDRRFTEDKFQFHVPIKLNFKASGKESVNHYVQEIIRKNGIKHIIGIDRGERHLLYVSIIDLNGKVVLQKSLNEIVDVYKAKNNREIEHRVNYHNLLDIKEENRGQARKNWDTIEKIAEIKKGYLSQVVHQISKWIVEYDAIVVLENLNIGFMRGRQKIEKQVYQDFEHQLLDKLNFLVDKKVAAGTSCHVFKALQLADKFESFAKLSNQTGVLFYTQAWNTSKIDPTTGFVNLLGRETCYKNMETSKEFFKKFDAIKFNKSEDYFEFSLDFSKFNNKYAGTRTNWTLCSAGTRIFTHRDIRANNNFVNETIDLTKELKTLFSNAQIKFDDGKDLREVICEKDANFLKKMHHFLRLILQMRNSVTGTQTDYMISPVKNASGTFYNSSEAICGLPGNADANGAFNIARKGLMIVEKIKNNEKDLKIDNASWLSWAQKHFAK